MELLRAYSLIHNIHCLSQNMSGASVFNYITGQECIQTKCTYVHTDMNVLFIGVSACCVDKWSRLV